MQEILDRIENAYSFIEEKTGGLRIGRGIILGSGFSEWSNQLKHLYNIPYSDIPGFPTTSVAGHDGNLIIAEVNGIPLIIMQGRFHYYEGHSMPTLSIPVRVFKKLGVNTLILTNASGSINKHYLPGDLMIIRDHINLVQNNPLIGRNTQAYGTRFPDASEVYDRDLHDKALRVANELGLTAHSGVYVFTSGPAFETPAEIRMMRVIGADAVGMSTVPEAITACHASIDVLGLSLIANLGSGMADHALTHEDVMRTMDKVAPKLHFFLEKLMDLTSETS
ncbi:MAG: purine-nucleoside phosphorylase [Saprospiraceae bacterium]|nr:purine-nucleoside phosphorylase [Saprospiraceae bacterium]